MTEVRLRREGAVAVITLDAPGRRNALTPEMGLALVDAYREVDADDQVGALVVSGAGSAFCAGAALGTLRGSGVDPSSDEAYREMGTLYESFLALARVRVPTVAAVNGAAVGAGLNLALCADLRVVARDARLVSGFTRLGLHPGGGHFTLLGRAAGGEVAAALAVFGGELSGQRAVELGLAWEAVEAEHVERRAVEIAAGVAGDPALARVLIQSLRRQLGPHALELAAQAERGPQMWSMRRAVDRPAPGTS